MLRFTWRRGSEGHKNDLTLFSLFFLSRKGGKVVVPRGGKGKRVLSTASIPVIPGVSQKLVV